MPTVRYAPTCCPPGPPAKRSMTRCVPATLVLFPRGGGNERRGVRVWWGCGGAAASCVAGLCATPQVCRERSVTCECGVVVKATAHGAHVAEACPKTLVPCEYCTLKVRSKGRVWSCPGGGVCNWWEAGVVGLGNVLQGSAGVQLES
jgi:hypothetical protein